MFSIRIVDNRVLFLNEGRCKSDLVLCFDSRTFNTVLKFEKFSSIKNIPNDFVEKFSYFYADFSKNTMSVEILARN